MNKIVCISILLILLFLPLSNETNKVYVEVGNLWKEAFTEPYEVLYVLCENGDIYSFTTREESRIKISPLQLRDFLELNKHGIDDVILMIHNHLGYPFMSEKNMTFMKKLRTLGFTGVFCMLNTASGKMVCIRNDG